MSDRDDDATLEGDPESLLGVPLRPVRADWGVVVAWCREAPERIGEIAFATGPAELGRGEGPAEEGRARLAFLRQRPGGNEMMGPITARRMSRTQLILTPKEGGLEVENCGKCPLLVCGEDRSGGTVGVGDTLQIGRELVLVVVRRPRHLPVSKEKLGDFPFGECDPFAMVGESAAMWALRERLAFAGRSGVHVLLLGESGAGKELCARAIHRLSERRDGPLVARNAATLPEGLIDAELFGNVKNYPNPGMPERPGLVGEASGGTLFLDEIGELPLATQSHFLRVLDGDGEYQRLGEATSRRSSLRVVAATNRSRDELKHDLAARFPLVVHVPGLEARREDVPLLLRALIRAAASRLAMAEPTPTPAFVDALVRARFSTHVRQLDSAVLTSLSESTSGCADLTPGVAALLEEGAADTDDASAQTPGADPAVAPDDIGRDAIVEALASSRNSVTRAAKILGLSSRYALYRLLKKHDIEL